MSLINAMRGRAPRIALLCFVKRAQAAPAEQRNGARCRPKGRVRQTRRRRVPKRDCCVLGSNGPKTVRFHVGTDVGDSIHKNSSPQKKTPAHPEGARVYSPDG